MSLSYTLQCTHMRYISNERYVYVLTLKAPITPAADDDFFFPEKTSLDISCESSAKQTIHMKCQDPFSLKNKNKIECRLLQF